MSLTKSEVASSDYIETGSKKASAGTGKRAAVKVAQQLSTTRLAWIIITRHKVGMLMIGNIILVLNFILPEWFSMVLGLIGK